jgi:hypothetical protein
MYQRWFDGAGWVGWERFDGVLTSAPACVASGERRIDCFVRGRENRLYRIAWDGNNWTRAWEELGAGITSGPAAASWGPNRLSVFVRGERGTLMHKWWDGARWLGWEDLGGDIVSSPACTSWGLNRIDCFARGGSSSINPLNVDGGGLVRVWWSS